MKTYGKIAVLIAGAAMTMGNQKCQQQAAQPPARVLKKIVDMGAIRSSAINFPGGASFDFQFVANQQIYGVLQESKEFAFKYAPPIATAPATSTTNANGDTNMFNLTKADGAMMKASALEAGKSNYEVQYAQTAWCMANLPQVKIAGAVNSFELIGGGGITLGFTPAGAYPTNGLASAGLNLQFAQLDLSMVATRPLTSTVVGAANVTSKQTKTSVNFSLNFGALSVGPSAYYQTPLATVSKTALAKAVSGLSEQLKKDEWYTRVMANHDTHLIIVGGADVGLEVGDQLLVYNEEYYWDGEPCNSKYLGGGAAANAAVAKIEIDYVGDEIARGKVIEQNDYNAVVGAKVKLSKFHAADYVPPGAGVQPTSGSNVASNSAAPGAVATKPTGGR
ncbi:hypothetical protein [Bdellovibrio svalbardensis]|uniref:Uncharacterized protein n=1 Tax=Bdellovibrio svalbardensis TaxID=2972972 RepID=A0ABT6DKP9_9BACT|nr:hypothetical protein [Bdellovibrio svalbardensis]MDG0815688.1 hypothetical protein [Bdellovibrio svalbardensis]